MYIPKIPDNSSLKPLLEEIIKLDGKKIYLILQ